MTKKPAFKAIMASGMAATILFSAPAWALTEPQSGAADARVKELTYRDDDVFRVKGHYGFTTMIEFSADEAIETTSIGDSEAWQIVPSGHRGNVLFIKPLEPNAETNMTILTDERVYAFELSADTAESNISGDLNFRLRFIYPDDKDQDGQVISKPQPYDPLLDEEDALWNFNYAYSGSSQIRPDRAFDDGVFTYFKFSSHRATPAVFAVDERGNESLVNFNVRGQYLVVEHIGRQFTLRDGEMATCIFNESFEHEQGTQLQKARIDESWPPLPARKPDLKNHKQAFGPFQTEQSLWVAMGTQDANSSKLGFNQ